MKHFAKVSALLVAALCAAGTPHAQPEKGEASSDTQTKAERSEDAQGKEREKKGELEVCKEKAHGLDGPERARFMTDCLRGPAQR
jgi:hypothetical protein